MKERVTAFAGSDGRLTLWLSGETAEDRQILTKIVGLFADEINDRIARDDWSFEDIAEAGAEIIRFRDKAQKEEEDREDEAV